MEVRRDVEPEEDHMLSRRRPITVLAVLICDWICSCPYLLVDCFAITPLPFWCLTVVLVNSVSRQSVK
jgi:hypothetical protein